MKITMLLAAATTLVSGLAAHAECQRNPVKHAWNIHSGDQRIGGDQLSDAVSGKKVKFGSIGTEHYKADGSYVYQDNSGKYAAKSVKFYKDGSRCLNYDRGPRYDMYVVVDGGLVLINRDGGRYEGALSN